MFALCLLLNDMIALRKDGDLNTNNMNHGGTLVYHLMPLGRAGVAQSV
jgi:hypothetical protein